MTEPMRNHLGHTEDEIADRYEARRAAENAKRHAVVVVLPKEAK